MLKDPFLLHKPRKGRRTPGFPLFSMQFDQSFPPIQREQQLPGSEKKKQTGKRQKKKGAEATTATAAQWWWHKEKKRQWRRCTGCCVEGGWGGELLFFFVNGGFRSGRPTWHLQLSLRGPWLLRLIRLPERTIGVRCRTLVWIQPSFSNWIRSLSGSHGLVLRRGQRDTGGGMKTWKMTETEKYMNDREIMEDRKREREKCEIEKQKGDEREDGLSSASYNILKALTDIIKTSVIAGWMSPLQLQGISTRWHPAMLVNSIWRRRTDLFSGSEV